MITVNKVSTTIEFQENEVMSLLHRTLQLTNLIHTQPDITCVYTLCMK